MTTEQETIERLEELGAYVRAHTHARRLTPLQDARIRGEILTALFNNPESAIHPQGEAVLASNRVSIFAILRTAFQTRSLVSAGFVVSVFFVVVAVMQVSPETSVTLRVDESVALIEEVQVEDAAVGHPEQSACLPAGRKDPCVVGQDSSVAPTEASELTQNDSTSRVLPRKRVSPRPSAVLSAPPQSVYARPFALSINSPANLPFVRSIQSR